LAEALLKISWTAAGFADTVEVPRRRVHPLCTVSLHARR